MNDYGDDDYDYLWLWCDGMALLSSTFSVNK